MASAQGCDPISVCVCIPTYNRPEGLRRALEGLAVQTLETPFAVVIANNLPGDQRVSDIIEAFKCTLDIRTTDVTERGVSAVRNQAIAVALSEFPDLEWIAFQDDDEVASPGWLAALMAASVRWDADLVGGPVRPQAFGSPTVQALSYTYAAPKEGIVPLLSGAGNLLIRVRFLRGFRQPVFSLAYGASGGEDYEFFRCAALRGATMAWCAEAVMDEHWPFQRTKFLHIVIRSARQGIYMSKIDRRYFGLLGSLSATARSLVSMLKVRAPSINVVFLALCFRLVYFFGRLFGHFGLKTRSYVSG
jgi:succinoglycan biosynthesis protein ExoM